MPYALSLETARAWATERAVEVFAIFAGDLTPADLQMLQMQSMAARHDGAKFVVIVPEGAQPAPGESVLADLFVEAKAAPSPIGLFVAIEAAEIEDVRKLALLGSSLETLQAGRRAGAGAVVGIAIDPVHRRTLVEGEPDVILPSNEFLELDRARFSSVRSHRQRVMLTAGPVLASDRVHRAIAGSDLSPRESEFAALEAGVKRKLLTVAGVEGGWDAHVFAGGTSTAIEATIGSIIRPGKKLLVCVNGAAGERTAVIADRHGIPTVKVTSGVFEPIDPVDVAAALDADAEMDAVFVVQHETGVGLVNPIASIASEASRRGVLVALDANAAFGAEELPLRDVRVDVVWSGTDTCLHGLPGSAFVLVSPRGRLRIEETQNDDAAVRLMNSPVSNMSGDAATGPALYALEATLDELLDEGVETRRKVYRTRIAYLDDQLTRLGLETFVAPGSRSRSVRTVALPKSIDAATLHGALKAHGFVIDGAVDPAFGSSCRISLMGALKIEVIAGFVSILERVLARASGRDAQVS